MIVRQHLAQHKQEVAQFDEVSVKPPHQAPEFKRRLEEAMKKKKMDAPQLADASGIPKRSINNYITKSEPPFGRGALLAKVLGVDPYWLAGIEKPDATDERRARYERNSEDLSEQGERPPAQTSAEFPGGYFEIADNKITIDIIVRGPEDRVRLGGWRSKQRDNDDS